MSFNYPKSAFVHNFKPRNSFNLVQQLKVLIFLSSATNGTTEAGSAGQSGGIVSVHIVDTPDMVMRAMLLDLNPYGRVPTLVSIC